MEVEMDCPKCGAHMVQVNNYGKGKCNVCGTEEQKPKRENKL